MNRIAWAIALVSCLATCANAEVGGFVNEDGFVVLTGDGESLVGLDLRSAGGYLEPIPGDPPSAAPFQFLIANDPDQVTFGNLGTLVTLDTNVVLPVQYLPPVDAAADDLEALWGGRGFDIPRPFAISMSSPIVDLGGEVPANTTPTLPEPTGFAAAFLGGIAILASSRRGRSTVAAT